MTAACTCAAEGIEDLGPGIPPSAFPALQAQCRRHGLKYRTIVVDPPWDYTGTTFREGAGHGKKYANRELPYPSMTLAEIAALPVADWAADDAVLFLWTTSRYL